MGGRAPEVLNALRQDLPALVAGIFLCGLALVAAAGASTTISP